jgi:hypothetical protein
MSLALDSGLAESAHAEAAGAPLEDTFPPELVESIASKLLRFTRDEDEDEIARKIIGEVLASYRPAWR